MLTWRSWAVTLRRTAAMSAQVRTDYNHVSDADFARGRAQVLQRLLDTPRLFHTRVRATAAGRPPRAGT